MGWLWQTSPVGPGGAAAAQVGDVGEPVKESNSGKDGDKAEMTKASSTTSSHNSTSKVASNGHRGSQHSTEAVKVHSLKSWASTFSPQVSKSKSAMSKVRSDVETLDFVSFDDDPSLLRASRLSGVLAGRAKIFQNSGGSAHTYSLSEPVPSIDVFISHNWSVGRRRKFAVLSLYFNFWLATITSLAAQLLCLFLTARGDLPVVNPNFAEGDPPQGIFCQMLGIPIFLVMILFGGEVRKLLCMKEPTVFLDKTCIHQTNVEIMRKGITKLGAYLSSSGKMLVVYTDVYLQKLWTVYEVACFLSLHTIDDMILIPTVMSQTVAIGVCIMYLLTLSHWLLRVTTGFVYSWELAFFLLNPLLTGLFRRQRRERQAMMERFQHFTVENSLCAVETDRPLVYHNISELLKAMKAVPESAAQPECLEAFDRMVRARLPPLIEDAMGRHGARYRDMATLGVAVFGSKYIDSIVEGFYGGPWLGVLHQTVSRWTLVMAVIPLCFGMMGEAGAWFLNVRRWLEVLYIGASAWFITALGAGWWTGQRMLWNRSKFESTGKADLMLAIFLLYVAIPWPLAARYYGFSCPCKRGSREDSFLETELSVGSESSLKGPFCDPSKWEDCSDYEHPWRMAQGTTTGHSFSRQI